MSHREKVEFTSGMKKAIYKILLRPEVRRMVCPTGEPEEKVLRLKEALELGGLVVMRMPLGETGDETARALSVWVMTILKSLVLKRSRERAYPVMAYFDEVHNSLGQEMSVGAQKFLSWVTMARHHNVGVICSYQGYSMAPGELHSVFENNLRNKLVGGGMGPTDAQIAQKIFSNDAMEVHRHSRHSGGGRFSRSVSTSLEEVPRWSVDEIISLPRGQWLCSRVVSGLLQYPVLIQAKRPPKPHKLRPHSARQRRNGRRGSAARGEAR